MLSHGPRDPTRGVLRWARDRPLRPRPRPHAPSVERVVARRACADARARARALPGARRVPHDLALLRGARPLRRARARVGAVAAARAPEPARRVDPGPPPPDARRPGGV